MATDTVVLPVTDTYRLRQDRCVVEAAYRLLGQPLWRRRLPAEEGALTLGEEATMDITLSWLDDVIEFVGLPTPELTSVSGTVHLADEEHELTLRLRRVPTEQDTILLAGRGVLRLRRPLLIELAAEFTR
jgi:hypothetical protein